ERAAAEPYYAARRCDVPLRLGAGRALRASTALLGRRSHPGCRYRVALFRARRRALALVVGARVAMALHAVRASLADTMARGADRMCLAGGAASRHPTPGGRALQRAGRPRAGTERHAGACLPRRGPVGPGNRRDPRHLGWRFAQRIAQLLWQPGFDERVNEECGLRAVAARVTRTQEPPRLST